MTLFVVKTRGLICSAPAFLASSSTMPMSWLPYPRLRMRDVQISLMLMTFLRGAIWRRAKDLLSTFLNVARQHRRPVELPAAVISRRLLDYELKTGGVSFAAGDQMKTILLMAALLGSTVTAVAAAADKDQTAYDCQVYLKLESGEKAGANELIEKLKLGVGSPEVRGEFKKVHQQFVLTLRDGAKVPPVPVAGVPEGTFKASQILDLTLPASKMFASAAYDKSSKFMDLHGGDAAHYITVRCIR